MWVLFQLACQTPEVEVSTPVVPIEETDVDHAVEIARELRASPDDVDRVLADYNMTRDDLDDLMYDVASDPVQREEYLDRLN